MKQEIEDMTAIIPLVEALAKPSVVARHWEEVSALTKTEIPHASETFVLS
jgi:hypothetical protein